MIADRQRAQPGHSARSVMAERLEGWLRALKALMLVRCWVLMRGRSVRRYSFRLA